MTKFDITSMVKYWHYLAFLSNATWRDKRCKKSPSHQDPCDWFHIRNLDKRHPPLAYDISVIPGGVMVACLITDPKVESSSPLGFWPNINFWKIFFLIVITLDCHLGVNHIKTTLQISFTTNSRLLHFGKCFHYVKFQFFVGLLQKFIRHTLLWCWITWVILLRLTWNFHRTCVVAQGRNLLKFSIWPWRSRSPEVKRSKTLNRDISKTTGPIHSK